MDLERVNCQRLSLNAIRFNDSHLVLIDRERIANNGGEIMSAMRKRQCTQENN